MKRFVMILLCTLFVAFVWQQSSTASTEQDSMLQAVEMTLTEAAQAYDELNGNGTSMKRIQAALGNLAQMPGLMKYLKEHPEMRTLHGSQQAKDKAAWELVLTGKNILKTRRHYFDPQTGHVGESNPLK